MNLRILLFISIPWVFSALFSQTNCPQVVCSAIASNNGMLEDTLVVCVGDSIYLMDNGSTQLNGDALVEFEYRLGTSISSALDTLFNQADSLLFIVENAGIYKIGYRVTDENGCQGVAKYIIIAAYVPNLDFESNYYSCPGDSLHLIVNPLSLDSSLSLFNFSYDNILCIPDLTTQTSSIIVSEPINATIGSGSNINFIKIGIEHSYISDLIVKIQCPTGQTVTLYNADGGNNFFGDPMDEGQTISCSNFNTIGDHFDYYFGYQGAQTVNTYSQGLSGSLNTIPSGYYLPSSSLFGLVGCPMNGLWSIIAEDIQGADDGSIGGWSIQFNDNIYGLGSNFSLDINYSSDSINSYWSTLDTYTYLSFDLDSLFYDSVSVGSYLYTYNLIDNSGCLSTWDVDLTVNDFSTIFVGNDTIICKNSGINVDLSGVQSVGDPVDVELLLVDTFGDSWNGNTMDFIINGDTTNYTVASSFENYNFIGTLGDNIVVTFNPTGSWQSECEILILIEGDTVFHDGANGQVPISMDSIIFIEGEGFNVYWTPDVGILNNSNIPNPTIDSVGTHELVFHLDINNAPSCSVTDTIIVEVKELPSIVDSFYFACYNESISISPMVSGGLPTYTENWFGVDSSNVYAGSYPFVIEDQNGCFDSTQIIVSYYDSIFYTNLIINDVDCAGDSNGQISFNVNGGVPEYSINWFGEDSLFLAAGNYFVIITDSVGCKDTLDYSISEPSEIVVTGVVTDVQTVNDGEVDVAVIGGTGSTYTYSWSNGEMTEDITGLGGGDFIVTVTDSLGCTEVDTFTVIDPFLGIGENGMEGLKVYPNPVKDLLNIQLDKTYSDLNIQLYDSRGTLVFNQKYSGIQEYQISMAHLVEGTYFLKLDGGDVQKVIKVVKTN